MSALITGAAHQSQPLSSSPLHWFFAFRSQPFFLFRSREFETLLAAFYLDGLSFMKISCQDLDCKKILQFALDRPF